MGLVESQSECMTFKALPRKINSTEKKNNNNNWSLRATFAFFIRPKVAAHNTREANLRRPVLFVRDMSRQLKSDVHQVTKLDQLASIYSRAFRIFDSCMLQSIHPCSLQCVVSAFLYIRVIFYCTMSKALILSIFVLCFLAFCSSTHVKFVNCGKSSSDPLFSM